MVSVKELAAMLLRYYPPMPNVRPGRCALDGLRLGPGMGAVVVGQDRGGKVAILLHGNCLGRIEKELV